MFYFIEECSVNIYRIESNSVFLADRQIENTSDIERTIILDYRDKSLSIFIVCSGSVVRDRAGL